MEEKPKLTSYISEVTLNIILDTYSSDYPDICLAFNDLDENIVAHRNFHSICANYHRKNADTEQLCKACNQYITSHLYDNNYIEYKCGNGLFDIAFPIKFRGVHIGTFYIGQIFIAGEESDMEFFKNHAEQYGFDKEEYLKEAQTIKTLSRKQVDELVASVKNEILELFDLD